MTSPRPASRRWSTSSPAWPPGSRWPRARTLTTGCNHRTPPKLWITGLTGCSPLHPASGTGCNERTGGVQPAQPRGAAVAPEPSIEPSGEPSAACARGREALLAAEGSAAGGERAGEFFEALGRVWWLTEAQRARLTPAVLAALDDGWTPHGLAGFTGANTDGVRNPYAVLAARLSAAGLPPPAGPRAARPPWRGECDQNTRMPGFDGEAPRPARAASRHHSHQPRDSATQSGLTWPEPTARRMPSYHRV